MSPRSINSRFPVDPVVVEILAAVTGHAKAEGIDCMLVGATARDIMLTNVFGLEGTRATYDVDFAVAVQDWSQFDRLRARLFAAGTFKEGRAAQELTYVGAYGNLREMLDLVPFGGVSEDRRTVAWPPDLKIIMTVAGYDDVLAAAEDIEVAPGVVCKVVSLPGLAILKLVAWSDRGRANPRDAIDLQHLMLNYANAGNFARVYEEDGVIDAAGYDPDLAGVILLAKDIQRVAGRETIQTLVEIVNRSFDRLVREMLRATRGTRDETQIEKRLKLFLNTLASSQIAEERFGV